MAIRFRFEGLGETLLDRKLEGISDRGLDLRDPLGKVYDDLRQATRRRFDAQGEGDWPPLAASTVRAKAQEGLDPRVLHATGHLRRSLTTKSSADREVIVARRFLVYGTRLDYAGFHQHGDGRLPQRRVLRFPEAVKVAALKRIQRYAVTGEV